MSENKTDSKFKVTLDKSALKDEIRISSQAVSEFFCKQDDDRTEMSFNNLSQILKYFEMSQHDLMTKIVAINDYKKMTVTEFKAYLTAILKQIKL